MKNLLAILMMIAAMFLSAYPGNTGNSEEQENILPEFRAGLSEAVDVYYDMEQAFAADDGGAAAEQAAHFRKKLNAIDATHLPQGARPGWNKQTQELQSQIDNLIAATQLFLQREAFLKISEVLVDAVKTSGPLEKPAYLYHCPMALNTGGHWLSPVKEVANPYFGQEMMKCGTLVEVYETL